MTIKFAHIRNYKGFKLDALGNPSKLIPDNMGGMTIAYEKFNEFYGFDSGDKISEYVVAVAKCNIKDNFCKARGRIISSGRLASSKQSKIYQATSIPNLLAQVQAENKV